MAGNQVEDVRRNRGDAVKEQEAYDRYVETMRQAHQTPKSLKEIRGD